MAKKKKAKEEKKAPTFRVGKEVTVEEALGPQNKGVIPPDITDQKSLKLLREYRMDVVDKIHPDLGLQHVEDSPFPWISDHTVKLNLGSYREFATFGWINIGLPGGEKRQFNVALEELKGLAPMSVDFIFAPFVLDKVADPERCLKIWRGVLKASGCIAVVIEDRDKKIKEGGGFEACRFNEEELRRAMEGAGYTDLVKIGFNWFSLAGEDSCYSGFIGFR